MKNKIISLLATTCIMETAQIIFQTPWTALEAITVGFWICILIYFFIQELEDIGGRVPDDTDRGCKEIKESQEAATSQDSSN